MTFRNQPKIIGIGRKIINYFEGKFVIKDFMQQIILIGLKLT